MANPTVLKTVLCDGTKSDIQDCVAEEASIYPLSMVHPSEDHSPNGVKLTDGEDPAATGVAIFKIGVVEIEEIRPETQLKWNQSVAFDDNNHLRVHWLKPGDKFYAKLTNPGATVERGKQVVLDAGAWKKPDATAAYDVGAYHTASVEKTLVTGDTIGKFQYQGFGPVDLAG